MPNFCTVETLDLSGKRVVVSGGTQGIGAGIARFAAHLGATVAIIGRNSTLGNELVASFPPGGAVATRNHLFICADLSTIRGVKEAAQRVKDWAGDDSIDLLFQTQGGPPSPSDTLTDDGLPFYFAIQCMSRFSLPYTLAKLGAFKDSTVLSIASAGMGGNTTIDFDDFGGRKLRGLAKARASSAVIDSYTKEFNSRYSSCRALHTYPGAVRTNVMANSNTPWYVRILVNILFALPYITRSPDEYARVAMWLATSEQVTEKKEICSWTRHGTEAPLAAAAADDKVRVRVWEKLVGMVDSA